MRGRRAGVALVPWSGSTWGRRVRPQAQPEAGLRWVRGSRGPEFVHKAAVGRGEWTRVCFSSHAIPCCCARWSWHGRSGVSDVPPQNGSLLGFFSHRPLLLPADKATNPLNKDLDWDGINAFCEQLNKELEG